MTCDGKGDNWGCRGCLGTAKVPVPLVGDGCFRHGVYPAPPPSSVNLPGLPCPECWLEEREAPFRNYVVERLRLNGETGPGFAPWERLQEEDLAAEVEFCRGSPYVTRYGHPGSIPKRHPVRRLEMSIRLAFWAVDEASFGVSPVWLELP